MHHKQLTATVLVLTTAFLLSACSKISSSEVDASSIYGEIEVKRTESQSYIDVDASFLVGGSTGTMVYLVSPAGVTINGSPGSETEDFITNRVHYHASVSASAGSAVVRYTDKNSREYVNPVNLPGITYASAPASASKAAGFSISFSRSQAYVPGEQFDVQLTSATGGVSRSFAVVSGAASETHAIAPVELQSFPTGPLTVSVCLTRNPSATSPYPKGLRITVRSCANPVTVNLGS
jgi:hypothetical protein